MFSFVLYLQRFWNFMLVVLVHFLHALFSYRPTYSGVRRNCYWGGSFSGIWWSFAFGVRSLWRHNLTSYSCFQTNVLAKFVDIIGLFFYTHSPYFMCHWTEYKLSALHVRISEENKLNTTTQQFITTKISSCVLKQGASEQFTTAKSGCANVLSNTSSRVSSVRLDWLAHTPVCKIESCWSTQELRMRIKYARNCQFVVMYRNPAETLSNASECFCVKNCCFWARATVLSCYITW